MSRIPFALAVVLTLGLPLSSQSFAAQVTASRSFIEALPFEIPSLHVTGTVRAAPGNRLHVVTIALGEEPIETEVRRFVLVAAGGTYEPIGAGGRADIIIPFDRIPIGREVGQILPSDDIVSLTRHSAASVTLEVGPRGTVAFLYELPRDAGVRSLRLPDGRELATPP
jgi:hypothetical protein